MAWQFKAFADLFILDTFGRKKNTFGTDNLVIRGLETPCKTPSIPAQKSGDQKGFFEAHFIASSMMKVLPLGFLKFMVAAAP
jgi:hypothetical protein